MDEREQGEKPADAPAHRHHRIGEAPGLPRIAELVNRQPDEQEVDEVEHAHMEMQRQHIDDRRARDQQPETRHAHPLPRRIAERHQRGDEQIDGEEPDRDQRQFGRHADDIPVDARQRRDHHRHRPDEEQRHHRIDQPLHPSGKPVGIAFAVAAIGRPRHGVGIAADEEEQRHHLKTPGQPLRPWEDAEQMAADDAIALHIGRGNQPVADNHREDRQRAQEVDIAVAVGRRCPRHRFGACPQRCRSACHIVGHCRLRFHANRRSSSRAAPWQGPCRSPRRLPPPRRAGC